MDQLLSLREDLVRRKSGVEQVDAVVLARQLEKARAHPLMEGERLKLKPVLLTSRAAQALLGVNVEEEGEAGKGGTTHLLAEGGDPSGAQLPAIALVGHRRIIEAIAEHQFAGVEGWLNDVMQVLGSGGEEEERFGAVRDLSRHLLVKQEGPDPLREA
jgi:hypothetical protein